MTWKKTTPRITKAPDIPEIARTPDAIERALRAAKEAIEIGYGRRGDPIDRFATLRDLRDAGVANVQVGPGGAVVIVSPGPGDGAPIRPDDGGPDYGDGDFTRPPKPTNVRARSIPPDIDRETAASLGNVMVTWDSPGYHNHHYAEIYRMPHGALPSDPGGGGQPVFDINTELVSPDHAHGAILASGEANTIRGGSQATFVGVATGTIYMDRDLAPLPYSAPGSTDLDAALNPGAYYYWVRFVSRARVPGPISDRAAGGLSINPTLVLDLMTRNVTNSSIFRHLREWMALGSPQAQAGGSILQHMQTIIDEGLIQSLWSVRMQHQANGLIWTAGFGLSMDTRRNPDGDWESVSTFLVNANQFAIMGPNAAGGGARITSWQGMGSRLRVTLATAGHGFSVSPEGEPLQRAVLMIPDGDIRSGDPDNPDIITIPSFYTRHAGVELEVEAVSGATVTLTAAIDERHPQNDPVPSFSGGGSIPSEWNFALMPGSNIPFIVDTQRNVVGIRGTLIVDGLIRATEAEFNELRAGSAFIDHLAAETVNANLVIGQRIIAGTPGYGRISNGDLAQVSNYIVELNNPAAHPIPFRIYKPYNPNTGAVNHSIFDVDQLGNLYVGGHLSVRRAAVIRGQPQQTDGTGVLFSTGGGGWDTGANDNYALWIGPESGYGNAGELRRETNAIMWVKSSGRAGFNADVFLGGDPLRLPSGNGYITVKPRRDGGAARVFVSCTFSIGSQAELRNVCMGCDLYLVPQNYIGPGAGPQLGAGYDPSPQFVNNHVGYYGLRGDAGPGSSLPAGSRRVAGIQIDSRVKSRDIKSGAIQGSVTMPAGTYKIFLALWLKRRISDDADHGCFAVHPFAVQVNNDPDPDTQDMQAAPVPPRSESRGEADVEPSTLEGFAIGGCHDGAFVSFSENVHGQLTFELADARTGKRAAGYIGNQVFDGDKAIIYTDGINDRLGGLVAGEVYVLDPDNPGTAIERKAATFITGDFVQVLGIGASESSMDVELGEPVEVT